MDLARAERVSETAVIIPSVRMIGLHMHIGSQITTTEPCKSAVEKWVALMSRLRKLGHPIAWYSLGGGYGINCNGREDRPVEEFAWVIMPWIKAAKCRLVIEPWRAIVGNARILVSRVLYTLGCGLPGVRSGGFLARVRPITPLERGDLLATFSAGAYGMINASTYNTRP